MSFYTALENNTSFTTFFGFGGVFPLPPCGRTCMLPGHALKCYLSLENEFEHEASILQMKLLKVWVQASTHWHKTIAIGEQFLRSRNSIRILWKKVTSKNEDLMANKFMSGTRKLVNDWKHGFKALYYSSGRSIILWTLRIARRLKLTSETCTCTSVTQKTYS